MSKFAALVAFSLWPVAVVAGLDGLSRWWSGYYAYSVYFAALALAHIPAFLRNVFSRDDRGKPWLLIASFVAMQVFILPICLRAILSG